MVAEAKEVGPNRYRESCGRYLEDFKVGDVCEHRPGRTITETDNTWFTLLTMISAGTLRAEKSARHLQRVFQQSRPISENSFGYCLE